MSHLDEGTLHALLDGELDLAEVSEIQKHLGSCVACGSRLQEVKQVLAEADRLVGAMEVPAGASRPRSEAPRPEPQPLPSRPAYEPLAWDEPPVLLVPDPIDAHAKRRRHRFGGWLWRQPWPESSPEASSSAERSSRAIRCFRTGISLRSHSKPLNRRWSALRRAGNPSLHWLLGRTSRTASSRSEPQRPAPTPPPARAKVAVDTSTLPADPEDSAVSDSAAADSMALAEAAADSLAQIDAAAGVAATASARPQDGQSETEPSSSDALATRRAAAAALAELDRERQRQRANAATAALPPARVEAEAEPAPRPPTLEQRSQVYLRIGLDEAVKQLGGPVHVIEGMTPELIGLTRTQLIPGTTLDPSGGTSGVSR